ncbi:MAG: dephospho-CoA kinase [Sphingobacteriaceae bacterium]|nr:MAG: dephospho-CoA kinase [Pedobacter sp.]
MLKVGITGGIGSGKTTVCWIFEILGIPVFYADAVAKQVMHANKQLKQKIRAHFGEQSYTVTGTLNSEYLAGIVFNDQEKLEQLNALVHPVVFDAFETWVSLQHQVPYVLKEAALLFESDSHKRCDYTVLIKAPLDLKVQRVMQRDQVSLEEVQMRINKQLTDEQKQNLANFILINDEQQLLIPQVIALHKHFIDLGKESV